MRNKTCLSSIPLIAIVVLSFFFISTSGYEAKAAEPWKYHATLAGKNEVPAIANTSATGLADFRLTDNDTFIRYRVNLTGITNVTGAHIHIGKIGQNGDILVDLFQIGYSKHKKTTYGMILRGNITDSTLKGPMKGKTIADLVSVLNSGDSYVNVNSRNQPRGEVRGQIQLINSITK